MKYLHYDSWKNVFKKLEITNLLNLCEVNKNVRKTTKQFVKVQRHAEILKIDLATNPDWVPEGIERNRNETEIIGQRNTLRFVRNFGKFIKQIEIFYGENQKINSYINKYTRKNLETLNSNYKEVNINFKKPFQKVTKITRQIEHKKS